MPGLEILTPRLVLRPVNMSDAPEVQRAKEDMWDTLQLWMSWSYDDQKSFDAMEAYVAESARLSPYEALWAFRRDTGAFAVATGVHAAGEGVFPTGYWTAQDQQGQGFATEATNAAIRYAFGALKARQISINYYEGNASSAAVVRKLGFTPSHTVKDGKARCKDGALLDVHHFLMTSPEPLPPLEVSWT